MADTETRVPATRINGYPRLPELGTRPVTLDKPSTPREVPAPPTRRPTRTPSTRRTRHAIRRVLADDRTRTIARHSAYLAGGTRIVVKRAWDGRTTARYERMMRAAEAAGNTDLAQEWEQRAAAFRAARHQRRMDLLKAPQHAAKSAAIGVAATEVGLLALGGVLAYSSGDVTQVLAPTTAVLDFIGWVYLIGTLVWGPLITIGPWVALLALWNLGRRQQAAPNWALPAKQRDTDGVPITPSIVVTALRDLGVSALRKAIIDMGDAGAGMLGPIRIAGCGVEVDVTLPSGVSTDEVQARRRKLAENLSRHEHEVFPTISDAARTIRLWIADSGALDEPIGPSPLVLDPDMTADYKTGRAPWGQSLRGDAAALSLYQRHLLVTGLSNQGKTAALRALVLWLALDPKVTFWLADLKGDGDWTMLDGLADVLIEGPTDEDACAATEMLEAGVAEMERRMGAPKGSYQPLVIVVDEAQRAFMNPLKGDDKRPYGGSKATSRYFMAARKLHNQGRAVDVILWQGTQDPTDQNLPKLVREGAHTRASLALGTESQAKMALGDKAVDGGAAPHLLRQGLDKGTLVIASDGIDIPAGEPSITVRTHFISNEEAVEVAERAKARRTGVTTRGAVEPAAPVDYLADIAAAIGDTPRMRTQEVLQHLAQANPGEYREWTFSDLTDVLEEHDAAPYKSDGRMVVARDRVHEAIANRETE